MFEPIAPRETAVDACARAIRDAIVRGELAAGERLPPERRLAETFGVNRVTVRSALARLEAARLLRVRQGSGYLVCDYRHEGGPELLGDLAGLARRPTDRAALVDDLLRVRRHLARAVLERLADRPASSESVQTAVAAFARVVDEGGSERAIAEADLAIVRALLEATESPVMQLCLNPIERAVRDMPALRAAIYQEPRENLAGWQALVAWLERPGREDIEAMVAILEQRDAATIARLSKKGKRA
jgi:GntR family transcriptional regulator, transcriptional repressor for pyruvate dehydrogenase complex